MTLNDIISAIKKSENIAILPHVYADGDALGSCLALGLALKKLNMDVKIYLEEDIPYVYSFLPGKELAEVYFRQQDSYETVIALDTGDMERLGSRAEIFRKAHTTINIDHHKTNTEFAYYNYVQASSAAVGEIVYELIKTMGVDIDKDMSTCLYVAISTDTGGFKYSNTTSQTHQIAGNLIKNGLNIAEISRQIFDSTSYEKVKVIGEAINALELLENGKVSLITITDEILKRVKAKEEDCDGIVNIGRNIRGVEVAAVLRQRDSGEVKVNLRSNEYVDVSAIASMFGGGGHKRAAGCTVNNSLDKVREMLLNDIKEVL